MRHKQGIHSGSVVGAHDAGFWRAYGGVGRDIFNHNGVSADIHVIANFYATKHYSTCPYAHIVPDCRVATSSPANGNALIDPKVSAYCFGIDYHSPSMFNKKAAGNLM